MNKPVAWRSKDHEGYWCIYQSPVEGAEPLYTGFKQLTDEEIEKIWNETIGYNFKYFYFKFAKAILRKAQEK